MVLTQINLEVQTKTIKYWVVKSIAFIKRKKELLTQHFITSMITHLYNYEMLYILNIGYLNNGVHKNKFGRANKKFLTNNVNRNVYMKIFSLKYWAVINNSVHINKSGTANTTFHMQL